MQSVEFILDHQSAAKVEAMWRRLENAGVTPASKAGGGHARPHVTALASNSTSPEQAQDWARQLRAELPLKAQLAGVGVFGTDSVSLLRLVDVPARLTLAVMSIRADVVGLAHPGWLPHLTLARRLEPRSVAAVLSNIDRSEEDVTLLDARCTTY